MEDGVFSIIQVSDWVKGFSVRGWFASGRVSENVCMLDVYYFDSAETSNTDRIRIDLVVDLVNGNCESTGLLAAVRRYSIDMIYGC